MTVRTTLSQLVVTSIMIALTSGCLSGEPDSLPFDDRAIVPPLKEGFREFRTGDVIIPPNTEKMICFFLQPEPETLYARNLHDYQGASGHHVVLFRALEQEEPGTIRDCTEIEDMGNLIPVIAPIEFGLGQFPEGMAIKIPAGSQLVIQQHTLNLQEREIVTNDAMHVELIKEDDVEILAGFFGLSDVHFEIPPHSEMTVEIDCEVPGDIKILTLGGHMHEWGTRYEALAGSPEHLSSLLEINTWLPVFRDEPPVMEWPLETPLVLHQGDIVRTVCQLENTTDSPLGFPEEMCATFGYYYPAIPGRESWLCNDRE